MGRRKLTDIRVTVRQKRGKYHLRYRHPITGDEVVKVAKKQTHSEALREAAVWENQLNDSEAQKKAAKQHAKAVADQTTWKEFRRRFEDEHLIGLAESTDLRFTTVLNAIETYELPSLLVDIDTSYISQFKAHLTKRHIAPATIGSHLGHMQAMLGWAKSVKLLHELPDFPRVKRARKGHRIKPMKGRAIRDEEFPQMLQCIAGNVPPGGEARWNRFLRGLYWGGLRLEEGLDLWWDRLDKMRVDLSGKYPKLYILADTEKGGQDRIYPIAPEFLDVLLETPESERHGLVFPLKLKHRGSEDPDWSPDQVGVVYASQRITAIGKAAGIATDVSPRTGKKHFVGAHDLRRSFGTRWCRRVLPQVLQIMMRHEDIDTTMRYYVDLQADDAAADIWAAYWAAVPQKSPEIPEQANRPRNPHKYCLIWKYPSKMKKWPQKIEGDIKGDSPETDETRK